ncbi:MAG TPA: SPOR domain-containing protein [Thermoanaerobaculia bacterium]|nr:SPOR domain-containing protein [Thermoanaerobaculia bacterium]
MKQLAALAVLVWLAAPCDVMAQAAGGMFGAKRAAASYTLKVRESQTIPAPGATAAWAIDANVVDVAAQNGSVTLFARAAGRTKIIIISSTGEQAFDVVVQPAPGLASAVQKQSQANHGVAEVRYNSGARELQNSVTLTRETKTQRTEVHVTTSHAADPIGTRAQTSIPSASIRFFTRGRELTLFDRDVDHSPLTLSHVPIRGVHYLDDRWRVHAGYTAYTTYESFFVPLERDVVAGAAYAFRAGTHSRVTPGLFAYRGEGTVLSLLYDYDDTERLALRAELGYSRGVGVAAELAYVTERNQARADVRYRPEDFAVPSAGHPRGLLADASWSHTYGRGSNAMLTFAATDFAGTRVIAGSADVDHRVSDRLSLTGGASWGRFAESSSLTLPIGARLDIGRGSVSALYRYAQSSTNRGGHGFRVSARRSFGRLYANAYFDRQQNAPTLELIFNEHPELALALQNLGITATSPAAIARALREHAALIELGYIEGVTVDLAPIRTQLGFELAFLGASRSRQQLRARFIRNVTESVASRDTTTIATLTYSRRIAEATDLFAGYTYWRTERRGDEARVTPHVEVGVRQRFDGLPSLLGNGNGTISGVVFADEDLDGVSDGTPVMAEVELDGTTRLRTNPDGTFSFRKVARGAHRVTVHVPDRPDAYFTTPSRVELEAGDEVAFGVAYTPARLVGRVTSDAGAGIGNVRVLLSRGTAQVVATTASDGRFMISAAPGEWQVSLLGDSVPAGYSLAGTDARAVMLERTKPQQSDYTLRAHRTIAGSGAPANAELEVRPLGRKIKADEQGRFSLRSLPAGEVTVVANGVEHRLVLPAGPATLTLDVAPKVAVAQAAPMVRTEVAGERRENLRGYVVAIGAFRVRANAVATADRARRSGVAATLDESGSLTVVRAGPYETRPEAAAAADKLTRAGMDALVMSTK